MALTGVLCASPKAYAADMESKAGAVTTTSGNLYVRRSPSTGASAVASLNKGSYVTLLGRTGDWWHVEYAKGQYGYCHANYITVVQGTPTRISDAVWNLNVRSGPGTSHWIQTSLPRGETVVILASSGGWSRVLYNGISTGYVSEKYLTSGSYSPVSLAVPSYKQTDARWANKQVGSSGKTFSQIGCATTGIAMMESYRTGTTIYPDAMSKQLRYTASGSVYWPAHYTVVTDASGYLEGIYKILKEGRPVLLGMRNSAGKQHWVVVTGFSGGAKLSAEAFQVHDPGTYKRTNLQQLIEEHPLFYKYFYYA